MTDGHGLALVPLHVGLGTALQPVPLKGCLIEQPVGLAMAEEAFAARATGAAPWAWATGAEITHRVAPTVGEQVTQAQGVHFLGPDAIGVGPGGGWITGGQARHRQSQGSQLSRKGKGRRAGADHQDIHHGTHR